jgi:carbon-monoxide dehydrogenase large subunit
MAFDREGKILGLRTHFYWSIGAYTSTYVAIVTTNNIKNCLSSVYQIPVIYIHSEVAHTNTVPLGPYRGAGRPEAIYLIERLLDKASVKLVIDRIELRRRNMIPSNLMPYTTVNGQIYDSGDFETVMNQALTLSNWATFPDRQKEAAQQGKLRGIGICCFLEVSGGILEEPIEIEFLESGDVCLKVGAQAMGQGHINTLPRIVQAKLGIPLERIRIISGDSQQVPGIVATVASRSMMMVGNAIAKACDEAIIRGKELAAILWNQSAVEIEFIHGHFQTKDKKNQIPLIDITRQIKTLQLKTPEILPTMSLVTKFTSPTMSYPNGAHVCEVEIDPSTGVTQFIQHTAIDDVGVILNQEVVEGQIVGAIAQAYGQTLGEYMHYDESGQLLNPSFMDYPIMRADNMPKIILQHHVTPCQNNPLGVKGAGESGIAGALPSSINAILHALGSQGIVDMDLPFTPNRIWDALQKKT